MTATVWGLTFGARQKKLPSSSGITGGVKIVAASAAPASTTDSTLASRNLRARLIVDLLRARRYLRRSGVLPRSVEAGHGSREEARDWFCVDACAAEEEGGAGSGAYDPNADRGLRLHESAGATGLDRSGHA